MKIGIILQARMGSSRLSGKTLKPIGSQPLLAHIFDRLTFLQHPAQFVLATSVLPRDDVLESFCMEYSIDCFRGCELDVLERYYLCVRQYGFHHVVRLTGDNPFVDIEELGHLIDLHLERHAEYTHSFDSLPVGCGAEIFNFEALERSYFNGKKPNHREHVNEYIQENPGLFRIASLKVASRKKRPDVRLTVDTSEDYRRACYIAEKNRDEYVTTEKAIDLCLEFENTQKNQGFSKQRSL
jgi:spore coat polysaccharide biosynthesis protein SpsF